ncbi:MAG: D-mannonate oxidoreductase, partial [Sphingobacteriales bacterium 39-40-5]
MSSENQFSLSNKVVVVTGGTGILGGSFVKAIAQAGGIPVIMGRNAAIAEARAQEIIQNGGQALAIVADVLQEADLIKARDLIVEKLGRIDGLVNGAGGNMPEGVVQP